MGREDWYRNTDWNPEIATQFLAKLKRASNKGEYLRIQAYCLTKSHPEDALTLLERYLSMPDAFDRTSAYVQQAEAFLTLGEIDKALASYELALAREREHPNILTQAYLDLPFLVATMGRRERYSRAVDILTQNRARPMFPNERFRWNAASALICEGLGDRS